MLVYQRVGTYECIHLALSLALCISCVPVGVTFRRSKRSTFRRSKRTPDRVCPTPCPFCGQDWPGDSHSGWANYGKVQLASIIFHNVSHVLNVHKGLERGSCGVALSRVVQPSGCFRTYHHFSIGGDPSVLRGHCRRVIRRYTYNILAAPALT